MHEFKVFAIKKYIPLTYLVKRIDISAVRKIKGQLVPDFVTTEKQAILAYYSLDSVNNWLLNNLNFAIVIPEEQFIQQISREILSGTAVISGVEVKLGEDANQIIRRDILNALAWYSELDKEGITWALRYLAFRRKKDKIKTKCYEGTVMGKTFNNAITRELVKLEKTGMIHKEARKWDIELRAWSTKPLRYWLEKPISTMTDIKYLKPIEDPIKQKNQILMCLIKFRMADKSFLKEAEEMTLEEEKKIYGYQRSSTRYIQAKKL